MRKIITIVSLTILCGLGIHSCALKKVKALANCEFKFDKINSLSIAGVEINTSGNTQLDFKDALKIASAYSRKSLPANLDFLMDINNPNSTTAKMTRFDWKIHLKEKFVTRGKVNSSVEVPGKSSEKFPFKTEFDLYSATNDFSLDEIKNVMTNAFDNEGNPKDIQLYIKPYILGIPYPGFIELTKYFKSN